MMAVKQVPLHGDSVSQLLQMTARQCEVSHTFSGKGDQDLREMLVRLRNAELTKNTMWTGIQDLFRVEEMKSLPEPIQAMMAAIILRTRACMDLQTKTAAQTVPPQSAAPSQG